MKKGYSVLSVWCLLHFQNTTTTPALTLSSLMAPSSTKISKKLEVQPWAAEAIQLCTEIQSVLQTQGSCKFRMPQVEEATQFGILLSLATEGKRKAVYKHRLLLQQFVNLAHLSHALFMSEWKTIGFVSARISKCWKEWQISVFHFGHTNTQSTSHFQCESKYTGFPSRVTIKQDGYKRTPWAPLACIAWNNAA